MQNAKKDEGLCKVQRKKVESELGSDLEVCHILFCTLPPGGQRFKLGRNKIQEHSLCEEHLVARDYHLLVPNSHRHLVQSLGDVLASWRRLL